MSTTLKPPAPSKWAMEACQELRTLCYYNWENHEAAPTVDQAAAIIQRHHAAAQAETVALLEEANDLLQEFTNGFAEESGNIICSCCGGSPARGCKPDCRVWLAIGRLTTHLARLKEGAP